ncbi:DNA sulfur modification protein DndD [Seongchinamella sediminis]|uniref:DNA sulfur modification protein DndD n=1 Tax=Seongchinamella sediminis TaxID=2283635 RepID=A0A3L7DT71_9GAMM|nr:DNA sulfur modification protein DndD [Seongchinamella sediminis]RLQ20256.1 DNA sulfur modification protein DndD [Seongchinamella sediminis]
MIINSLTLNNFRVFQGSHTIDLAPRVRWNAKRPIVLFGGLNGAGKTTTLTAVRLVLYGRQSLGVSTSLKSYHEYLDSCIHKSRDGNAQANGSAIELSFDYSHMGVRQEYTVSRSWIRKGSSVKEFLQIVKDGKPMEGFTYEQSQGFLNELIPIGVSDLFFFDGEKISELATDESGIALSNSIKRLLGLDLVDRLNSDLGVLVRNKQRDSATKDLRDQIELLESKLEFLEAEANKAESEFRDSYPEYLGAKENLELANREFLASGGAWAITRDQEIRNQEKVLDERANIEKQMRDLFGGAYPLSLAPRFCDSLSKTLENEEAITAQLSSVRKVNSFRVDVEKELDRSLNSQELNHVKSILRKVIDQPSYSAVDDNVLHDIGGRTKSSVQSKIYRALEHDALKVKEFSEALSQINLELDQIGERISRAPDEGSVSKTLEELSQLQKLVNDLEVQRELKREEARRLLREAADVARQLDELYLREGRASQTIGNINRAKSVQSLLERFSAESAAVKTKQLELEFSQSFQRLARKDDICLDAKIDPVTFSVSLVDASGKNVEKNSLSAGEKQIYAISILEALAKTSGRKLPIIIDTPLGRLDSKHRSKLVKHYFPTASHQVLILSTDTEVDEKFYSDLYRDMSHAFKLSYDSETGSTVCEEGYFWRSSNTEAA